MVKYAYLIPIEVILVKSISKTFLKHSDKLRKSNSEICTFRLTLLWGPDSLLQQIFPNLQTWFPRFAKRFSTTCKCDFHDLRFTFWSRKSFHNFLFCFPRFAFLLNTYIFSTTCQKCVFHNFRKLYFENFRLRRYGNTLQILLFRELNKQNFRLRRFVSIIPMVFLATGIDFHAL